MGNTTTRDDLKRICDAIQFDKNVWKLVSHDFGDLLEINSEDNEQFNLSRIKSFLYAHFYAGSPELCDPESFDVFTLLGQRSSDLLFLTRLKNANPITSYYQPGWTISSEDAKSLWVQKGGVQLKVNRLKHLLPDEQDAQIGETVSIAFPADSVMASTGFYSAFSAKGPSAAENLCRVYMNLKPDNAPEFMNGLLSSLTLLEKSYSFKILSDPQRFGRRDSAVLYIDRWDLNYILNSLSIVYKKFFDCFSNEVPGFTFKLAPGLALASNPNGPFAKKMSFGEHRCSCISQILLPYFTGEKEKKQKDEWLQIVEKTLLNEYNLDPNRLYLNSPDEKDYKFINFS